MLNISSRLIIEEAQRRGWKTELVNEDHSSLVYIQPPNKAPRLFKSSVTVRDSALGYRITDDKYLTYLLLRSFGLPVPPTALVTTEQDVIDFYTHYGSTVVKPAAEDHGTGVTVGVDASSAVRALEVARQGDNECRAITQKMLRGEDHRFLVVGKAVFVARRHAPSVVGNGVKTLAELVADLNRERMEGDGRRRPLVQIPIENAVEYTKLSADIVPRAGEGIKLLGTANLSKGGWAEDLTDVAHESLKAVARRAADLMGVCVCGVDILCDDVTKSADDQEVGIIEMNVSPGIRMHHFAVKGAPHNAAGANLDAVFEGED